MELETVIQEALEATARLRESLGQSDPETAERLLEERGAALQRFEIRHRAASEAETTACSASLRRLVEADSALREETAALRDGLERDLRTRLGTAGGNGHSRHAEPVRQACVDRKA